MSRGTYRVVNVTSPVAYDLALHFILAHFGLHSLVLQAFVFTSFGDCFSLGREFFAQAMQDFVFGVEASFDFQISHR